MKRYIPGVIVGLMAASSFARPGWETEDRRETNPDRLCQAKDSDARQAARTADAGGAAACAPASNAVFHARETNNPGSPALRRLEKALQDCTEEQLRQRPRRVADTVESSLNACRVEAQRRRSERLAILATRPLSEIEHIEERYRLPEEQQRLDRAAQERADHLSKLRGDTRLMRAALSAAVCVLAAWKKNVMSELATEKKYARVGGVIDRSKIYGLQQRLRAIDEAGAEAKTESLASKASLLGCRDKSIADYIACLSLDPDNTDDESPAICQDVHELVHLPDLDEATGHSDVDVAPASPPEE